MASLSYTNILYINHKDIVFGLMEFVQSLLLKTSVKQLAEKFLKRITLPQDIDNIYLCGKKVKNKFII